MNEATAQSPSPTGESAPCPLWLDRIDKVFAVGKRRQQALDQVSCRIQPRQVTGLIGPDGAGKTTLLRLCTGLLLADTGTISVLGLNPASQTLKVQTRVGYMPQRFGLYQDLSVQENLDLYADLQGVAKKDRPDRYAQLLAMAGLEGFRRRLAGRLSGGMKQKLGLICTLIHPPSLLLLDEPTVGVDPVSRRELWRIVYHLVEGEGMSVVLSTSYLDEAERCAEIILLHQGRIIGQDRPGTFSGRMSGRTVEVRANHLSRRHLQQRLQDDPAVIDALLLGQVVRVVTRPHRQPNLSALGPGEAVMQPVAPRFEDYFVATLRDNQTQKTGQAIDLQRDLQSDHREEVIQVEQLARCFGAFTAVDHISFTVHRGEVFGLLGANGAGKTTTFRMLCGLLPITSGQCRVAGEDLRTAAAQARAHIGYMAQRFALYGNLTVLQNLKFFASAYNLRGATRKARIEWALETFDLTGQQRSESQTLPLGYKQRLALAVALMHRPEVLFLDEPTSGVDPLARRDFWTLINSLAEQGVTVLVTTHFMEEAEYCDRLVIMAEGRVLAQGSPEEIKSQSAGAGSVDHRSMEEAFINLLKQRPLAQGVA